MLQHRSRMLVLVSAAYALVLILFLIYQSIVELIEAGRSDPAMVQGLIACAVTLGGQLVIVYFARRGDVGTGVTIWLALIVLTIVGLSVIEFQRMMAPLFISIWLGIFSVGVLIHPTWSLGWSVIAAAIIAVMPLGLSTFVHVTVVFSTLLTGLLVWWFGTVVQQLLFDVETFRQQAMQLRDDALALADDNAESLHATGREIKGRASLLLAELHVLENQLGSHLDESGRDLMRMMRSNVGALNRQAQALFEMSHTRQTPGHQRTEMFSPAHLLNTIVSDQAPLAQAKGLAFRCVVHPHVPDQVQGDPLSLRHAVSNVVDNAIRYTLQGSVTVEARLVPPSRWSIVVSDTGPGVHRAHLDRLSEPFYRLEPSIPSAHEGYGMGLTLAKDLVEFMGGTLIVASSVDTGTHVTITLPLQAQPGSPPTSN